VVVLQLAHPLGTDRPADAVSLLVLAAMERLTTAA
jgi:hypothetical protein